MSETVAEYEERVIATKNLCFALLGHLAFPAAQISVFEFVYEWIAHNLTEGIKC